MTKFNDDLIKESWEFYKKYYTKLDNLIGYGLTKKQAEQITKFPEWVYFFEGQCFKILSLDPELKHISEQEMISLFNGIANEIIQNKDLKQRLNELWKTESFVPSKSNIT